MIRAISIILLFYTFTSHAQGSQPDTVYVKSTIQKTKDQYTDVMLGQSYLYNGRDYIEFDRLVPGQHPFFGKENEWVNGSILYNGELYNNIPILYDICRDIVVIEHYYNHSMMRPVAEKVSWFSIDGHTFVHLGKDQKSELKDGYYDRLYDGSTKFYARRVKLIEENLEHQSITYYFWEKTTYHILRNGIYFPVGSRSSVLKILEDHKRELRKFLKEKKIIFQENREKSIKQMLEFYDALSSK